MRIPALPKIFIAICALVAAACSVPLEATPVPAKVLEKLAAAKADARSSLVLEGLALEGGEEITLELERFEVFAPSFRLAVDGVLQPVGAGRPDTAYFRGTVRGDPGSLAMLAVGKIVDGFIQTSCGAYVVAQEEDTDRSAGSHVVHLLPFEDALRAQGPVRCDVGTSAYHGTSVGGGPWPTVASTPTWSGVRNVDVAVETDYEFCSKFPTREALLTYIGSLFAAASAIYHRDIKTTLQIPFVQTWSSSNDPWFGTNASESLRELGNHWHNNMSKPSSTAVHMLSARETGGGMAWIEALCREDWLDYRYGTPFWSGAYGFSGSLKASFSTLGSLDYNDLIVVTHELGHNFGSQHTHCYGPPTFPVDHCYSGQADCYNGPTSLPPGGGTLMSYCHVFAEKDRNINLVFGVRGQPSEVVLDTMRSFVESVTCSCQPPYAPALAYPANGATGATAGTLYWENPYFLPGWVRPSGVTAYDVYLDTVDPPEKRISTSSVDPWMAMPTWFPNTTYYWKVVAKNGCGSASSLVYSFTTGAACSFTGAVPVLSDVVAYGRKAELSWSPVPGAAHYTVFLGTTNPPAKAYMPLYAPKNWLEVVVAPGTTYFWGVKATPGCGNSAATYSSIGSFTTAGSAPVLVGVSPTSLNRWDVSASLFSTGTGLSSDTLLFVDSNGRKAGTFTLGGASPTGVSGTIVMDAMAPSGWYDAGLTNYGFENQRLPLTIAVRAFTDVTENDFYFFSSARVVDAGIMEADFDAVTTGPQFSPSTPVTREFMAEYLAKAYQWWRTGSTSVPAATCVPSGDGSTDFPDVPCSHPRWLYIHWIKTWGVTTGAPCNPGPGNCYYPTNTVDRSQMVTFLLRLKYGSTLPTISANFGTMDPGCAQPWPTCVGWADPGLQIPLGTWPHLEVNVAFSDRLTSGCAATTPRTFCVFDPVSRGQMVEFLARIVNIVPNP